MEPKHPGWLDKESYPFEHNYFAVDGQKMHYIDEGKGEVCLFVHGTPSWSFEYRKVIRALQTDFRCIATDHIGFGLSDKPAEYDYSTRNHSNTLERFILDKDLQNINLVVHDFGGPIGLNVAIQHPERFRRVVILNSWLWSSENDPEYIKLRKTLQSPLLPFLYKYLNFSPRFILPNSFGSQKPDKKTRKHYIRPFANKNQRNGALAFARSLLNDQPWFETLWNQRKAIANKPILLIWGMKDPFVRPKHLEKFQSGFPQAQALKLENCGHFPQEEEAENVTRNIRAFLEKQGTT